MNRCFITKGLETERGEALARYKLCPPEVAVFVFSQPSVSPDKDLTDLEARLDGTADFNGQRVLHYSVSSLEGWLIC